MLVVSKLLALAQKWFVGIVFVRGRESGDGK